MAEKFTVYSFQLRPDDFTKFVGAEDTDYHETNSEDIFELMNDDPVLGSADHNDVFNEEFGEDDDVFGDLTL